MQTSRTNKSRTNNKQTGKWSPPVEYRVVYRRVGATVTKSSKPYQLKWAADQLAARLLEDTGEYPACEFVRVDWRPVPNWRTGRNLARHE